MEPTDIQHTARRNANLVGLCMLLFLLLRQGTAWLAGQWMPPSEAGQQLLRILLALAVFIPVVCLVGGGKTRAAAIYGSSKSHIPLPVLLGAFFVMVLGTNLLSALLRRLFSTGIVAGQTNLLPHGFAALFLYFVASCVLPAVLEELLFRGMVQGLLRPFGAGVSVACSTLWFFLVHTPGWDLPIVLILGLALGLVRELTGSLRPCILLHFTNNTFAFVALYIRQQKPQWADSFVLLAFGLSAAMLLAALVWYRKQCNRPRVKHVKQTQALGVAAMIKAPLLPLAAAVTVAAFVQAAADKLK